MIDLTLKPKSFEDEMERINILKNARAIVEFGKKKGWITVKQMNPSEQAWVRAKMRQED